MSIYLRVTQLSDIPWSINWFFWAEGNREPVNIYGDFVNLLSIDINYEQRDVFL